MAPLSAAGMSACVLGLLRRAADLLRVSTNTLKHGKNMETVTHTHPSAHPCCPGKKKETAHHSTTISSEVRQDPNFVR